MSVIDDLLEVTCKNMIKTILYCLPNATKGTIYRIGPMPDLQAVRITSGVRIEAGDDIQWGLPSSSDYNPPGKNWKQYRDQPGRVLEAMGWCVEKGQSWTADNPYEDVRSVRKQLGGETEGFYHMEPVLVRTIDLYGALPHLSEYPIDWRGNPIWQETEYAVAAVIKIHFLSHSLRRDDRSTKVIKELSRTLGTELLSLYLHDALSRAQKAFARQRLQSCEILAHELRNTLVRFAFVFSAVNAQMGIVREQWEAQLRKALPEVEWKGEILGRLNELIRSRLSTLDEGVGLVSLCNALLADQEELAVLSLLPQQSELWVTNKIKPKWELLLSDSNAWEGEQEEIRELLDRLRATLVVGLNSDLASKVVHLPKPLVEQWSKLAYVYFTSDSLPLLEDVFELLKNPDLPVPQKHHIYKTLKSLKSLLEIVPQIEERANKIILSLRFGVSSQIDAAEELDRICRLQPFDETPGEEKLPIAE